MHGTHESKFDFLITVESVLRNRNPLNCMKGFLKAFFSHFHWQLASPGTDSLLSCQTPSRAGWFPPSQHTPGVRTEATPTGHSAGCNPAASEERRPAGSAEPNLCSCKPLSGTLGEDIKSDICQAHTVTVTHKKTSDEGGLTVLSALQQPQRHAGVQQALGSLHRGFYLLSHLCSIQLWSPL